jgi:hypothetical protein
MSNENEQDDRQLTPIGAELKIQKGILRDLRRKSSGETIAIGKVIGIIDTLESLLPKEKDRDERIYKEGFEDAAKTFRPFKTHE